MSQQEACKVSLENISLFKSYKVLHNVKQLKIGLKEEKKKKKNGNDIFLACHFWIEGSRKKGHTF